MEQTLISSVIDRDILNAHNDIPSCSSPTRTFLSDSNFGGTTATNNRERQAWYFSDNDWELLDTQDNRNSGNPL